MTRQNALAGLVNTFRLWIVVYPTVMIVLAIIGPYISKLDRAVSILITTIIVVTLVSNVLKPLADKLIERIWHSAGTKNGGSTNLILKQGQEQ